VTAFPVLPDTDTALIAFLAGHAALVPLHGGRVSDRTVATQTCIRVTPIGGAQLWPWEGVTEYQLECWGGTAVQALTLARTAVAVVYEFRGPVTGGHVKGAEVSLRPLRSDDANGRPRFLLQVQLIALPEGT
jgi:hypothetical protein